MEKLTRIEKEKLLNMVRYYELEFEIKRDRLDKDNEFLDTYTGPYKEQYQNDYIKQRNEYSEIKEFYTSLYQKLFKIFTEVKNEDVVY